MSRPTISATVSGPSGDRRRGAFEDSGYAGSAERLLDDHGPTLAVGMSLRSRPDAYIAMGQTAENGVSMCGIRRAEQDEFAVRSQNLAEQAIKNGFYSGEITPVELLDGVPSVFSTVISDASTSGSKVSSSSTAPWTSLIWPFPSPFQPLR